MAEGDSIYVEGIGHIGQHNSYLDCLWSKGVVYFVRDCFLDDIKILKESGDKGERIASLVSQYNQLNSEIIAYEQSLSLHEWRMRHHQ